MTSVSLSRGLVSPGVLVSWCTVFLNYPVLKNLKHRNDRNKKRGVSLEPLAHAQGIQDEVSKRQLARQNGVEKQVVRQHCARDDEPSVR